MSLQPSCLSREREGDYYDHTERHKARNVIKAAKKKASEIAQPMNIAVVDYRGTARVAMIMKNLGVEFRNLGVKDHYADQIIEMISHDYIPNLKDVILKK